MKIQTAIFASIVVPCALLAVPLPALAGDAGDTQESAHDQVQERYDSEGDGVISEEEKEAARGAMRRGRRDGPRPGRGQGPMTKIVTACCRLQSEKRRVRFYRNVNAEWKNGCIDAMILMAMENYLPKNERKCRPIAPAAGISSEER